ncbi:MAG: response regulator [Polaribacter sp.]|jgi:signal transduction histidine kinase/BarA-like signal transduction histidine kinase
MNSILGSLKSKRRIKLLSIYLYFSCFLVLVLLGLSIAIQSDIIFYACIAPFILYTIAVFFLKKRPEITRLIYVTTYLVAVYICASLFGKSSGVELYFTFFYLLIFIIFSYRDEKRHIIFFTLLTTIGWASLIYADFNVFNYRSINAKDAETFIYPISFLGNFILILITLIHFSYGNAESNKVQKEARDKALDLLKLKTIFLNAINEEIREPLNSIIGLTHILKENNPREDQKKNIQSLNLSGKNLLELLDNVLNLNELENNKTDLNYAPTNLKTVLNDIVQIYTAKCKEKNIELVLIIDDSFPNIQLDRLRYSQIINNLVSNAIKFTHKGTVTIQIIKNEIVNNTVSFTTQVTDSGIGIPEDRIPVIWDKFTQANSSTTRLYGGTGLGLPIVKNIVETMGSQIFVESEEKVGTNFYFDLSKKINNIDIVEEIEIIYNLQGKRILIVDDNKINILVCKQILEKQGIIVEEAYNGYEALEASKKNTYDLILMDLNMPIMSGNDAIKEIRKINTTIPILILTASKVINIKNIDAIGVNGFIYKPFEPKDLLNQINETLLLTI